MNSAVNNAAAAAAASAKTPCGGAQAKASSDEGAVGLFGAAFASCKSAVGSRTTSLFEDQAKEALEGKRREELRYLAFKEAKAEEEEERRTGGKSAATSVVECKWVCRTCDKARGGGSSAGVVDGFQRLLNKKPEDCIKKGHEVNRVRDLSDKAGGAGAKRKTAADEGLVIATGIEWNGNSVKHAKNLPYHLPY